MIWKLCVPRTPIPEEESDAIDIWIDKLLHSWLTGLCQIFFGMMDDVVLVVVFEVF
jgi:hypothetical protein